MTIIIVLSFTSIESLSMAECRNTQPPVDEITLGDSQGCGVLFMDICVLGSRKAHNATFHIGSSCFPGEGHMQMSLCTSPLPANLQSLSIWQENPAYIKRQSLLRWWQVAKENSIEVRKLLTVMTQGFDTREGCILYKSRAKTEEVQNDQNTKYQILHSPYKTHFSIFMIIIMEYRQHSDHFPHTANRI